jgi:hypothetical protein
LNLSPSEIVSHSNLSSSIRDRLTIQFETKFSLHNFLATISFQKIPFTHTKRKHSPLADGKSATQKQTSKRQKLFKIKNRHRPLELVPTPHSDHKHDSPPDFHYQHKVPNVVTLQTHHTSPISTDSRFFHSQSSQKSSKRQRLSFLKQKYRSSIVTSDDDTVDLQKAQTKSTHLSCKRLTSQTSRQLRRKYKTASSDDSDDCTVCNKKVWTNFQIVFQCHSTSLKKFQRD